jgi:NADH-quinone oxidoreductase subunit F
MTGPAADDRPSARPAPPDRPLTHRFTADGRPVGLQEYVAQGGYAALRHALHDLKPGDVLKEVRDSGLEGRGGAAFPAGRKWSFVSTDPATVRPIFLVCNADETEPGAFKDRVQMDGDPHLLVEGMALAAYAVEAQVAYLFVRAEYQETIRRLTRAITEAYEAGYLGKSIDGSSFDLELRLHVSAGRYICGEASAMLNALEGERPIPRHKPPHQTSSGLWSKPTVVNNVETLACVPAIVLYGAEWFKSLGANGQAGTKLYTVSGRVARPGAWELPVGTTIRSLIYEHAGGMRDGLAVRGVLPGGASTEFVLAQDLDTPMDAESLAKVGSRVGTGTLIVLDDRTCPVGLLENLERFYARESCGWCTPCWQGLTWVERLLLTIEQGEGTDADLELLDWHTKLIKPEHTFCDLATGAMEPLRSGLQYFREDLTEHVRQKACPYEQTGRWNTRY